MNSTKMLGVSAAIALLSACAQQPLTPSRPSEAPASPEPMHYAATGFSYEIDRSYSQQAEGRVGSIKLKVDGSELEARAGELLLEFNEAPDLGLLARQAGFKGASFKLESTPAAPQVKPGPKPTLKTFARKRTNDKHFVLVTFHDLDEADTDGLAELADAAGIKGRFEFGSKQAAALYKRGLLALHANRGSMKGFSYNQISKGYYASSEGVPSTSNPLYTPNSTAPDNGYFTWVGDSIYYHSGANIMSSSDYIWQHRSTTQSATIAVIDQGFQGPYESYIPGSVVKYTSWDYDFVGGDYDLQGQVASGSLPPFHGRTVASVIFSDYGDSLGTLGVEPESQAILLHTGGDLNHTINAIYTAVDWDANVINASWGYDSRPWQWGWSGWYDPLYDAVKYAYDNDVIFVAAAGNDGPSDAGNYPAMYSESIGVGAHNMGAKKSNSNVNGADIWSPGQEVAVARSPSTDPGNTSTDYELYDIASGTSVAAPIVAGVAGMAVVKGTATATGMEVHLLLKSYAYTAGPAINARNSLNY